MNNKDKRKQRPVTVMSYDDYEDIRESMNRRAKGRRAADRENMAKYYGRQRIFGLVILLVGVVCLIVGDGISSSIMEYFGAAVGLYGLYMSVTKHMILVDSYYIERQDKLNEYQFGRIIICL